MAAAGNFIAEAQALITHSRQHLLEYERQLHELVLCRAQGSNLYQELEAARDALSERVAMTEAALRDFAPDEVPPAVPPFAAELDRFSHLLGPDRAPQAIHRGPEVEALQRILAWEGLTVEINGVFNVTTAQALTAWQRRRGLRADGLTGAATRQALNALLAK